LGIIFANDGALLVSPTVPESVLLAWQITAAVSRQLTPAQRVYMEYHRAVVFKS